MRYVQVPASIRLQDFVTKASGEVVSFQRYAVACWLDDIRWETPKTNLLRLAKILPEFDKLPGEWMELEDQDWNILKNIIEKPGEIGGNPRLFMPLVQVQLGEIFDNAVLEAPSKKPAASVNGSVKEAPHDPS